MEVVFWLWNTYTLNEDKNHLRYPVLNPYLATPSDISWGTIPESCPLLESISIRIYYKHGPTVGFRRVPVDTV